MTDIIDKFFTTEQTLKLIKETKAYAKSTVTQAELAASQKRKRFLVLFACIVFGFALCLIVFWANFVSYEKSCQEKFEALEKNAASLELSLEKANGRFDGALNEIDEKLSEISAEIASVSAAPQEVDTGFQLPPLDTSFKSYMDYRTITSTTSDQYALQKQAYTDELGLRKVDGFYCIALGTYYTTQCGEKFKICTDNGNEFYVITADIKDNRHTDENNMYVPLSNGNANVVEFIVDTTAMEHRVVLLGDISGYEQFSGNIVKIERI